MIEGAELDRLTKYRKTSQLDEGGGLAMMDVE
jgi:hypothetical protein